MSKYPLFLELAGRRAVLVGGGTVAVRKARDLLDAGARLVVVSKRVGDALTAICQGTNTELIRAKYSREYLEGATIAIAATNDLQLNRQIYKDCQELGILCNVVDQPQYCDFFIPAVVKRGRLQIAVSTGGDCPAYARYLRKKLEKVFTEEHERFLAELARIRKHILKVVQEPGERKVILSQLVDDESFDHFVRSGSTTWRQWAEQIINASPSLR